MKKIVLSTVLAAACAFAAAPASYKACMGCHGVKGEKAFGGSTKIPANLTKAEVETALKGYAAGTYGGPQKGMMVGQAKMLDDAKIKELANYIGK